eukprot:TRINITY_DN3835_c0_g1_i1.p1 TRINITY_DN3835_c0_g1~~TRINITY_DN3835_c0_g1_i1.p1  ORF type:complete len:504 (-),score=62.53 TRINITY_DN3835_c0_g1_i1:126-1571(-)
MARFRFVEDGQYGMASVCVGSMLPVQLMKTITENVPKWKDLRSEQGFMLPATLLRQWCRSIHARERMREVLRAVVAHSPEAPHLLTALCARHDDKSRFGDGAADWEKLLDYATEATSDVLKVSIKTAFMSLMRKDALWAQRLQRVVLRNCGALTDADLLLLCVAGALVSIDVSGCRNVTARSVQPLVRTNVMLQHLNISDCAFATLDLMAPESQLRRVNMTRTVVRGDVNIRLPCLRELIAMELRCSSVTIAAACVQLSDANMTRLKAARTVVVEPVVKTLCLEGAEYESIRVQDLPSPRFYSFFFDGLLLGGGDVGKTSCLRRFAKNSFSDSEPPTFIFDFMLRSIDIDGQICRLRTMERSGRDRFLNNPPLFRNTEAVMVLFDVTKPYSVEQAKRYLELARSHLLHEVCMLVGNKIDLTEQRAVSYEEGQALADSYSIEYFETSAKDGTGIEAAFMHLARLCRKQKKSNAVTGKALGSR